VEVLVDEIKYLSAKMPNKITDTKNKEFLKVNEAWLKQTKSILESS
jgi:predicted metal-dependent hydrolase